MSTRILVALFGFLGASSLGCNGSPSSPLPDCASFELRLAMGATIAHGPERGAVTLPNRDGGSSFVSKEVLLTACDVVSARAVQQADGVILRLELSPRATQDLRLAMRDRQGAYVAVSAHGVVQVGWSSAILHDQTLDIRMFRLSLEQVHCFAQRMAAGKRA